MDAMPGLNELSDELTTVIECVVKTSVVTDILSEIPGEDLDASTRDLFEELKGKADEFLDKVYERFSELNLEKIIAKSCLYD